MAAKTVEDLVAGGSAVLADLVLQADATAPPLTSSTVTRVRQVSRLPDLSGVGVRQAASDQELYQLVTNSAGKIGPKRDTTKVGSAFNAGMRALYGVGQRDLEFILVRLDAHHLIEWRFLQPYASDVASRLDWSGYEDADCMLILYEEHILGVPGKTARDLTPAQPSLTTRLTQWVQQQNPKSLLDVVDAHYSWYLDPKSATVAQQYLGGSYLQELDAWFTGIYQKLGTVPPPLRK